MILFLKGEMGPLLVISSIINFLVLLIFVCFAGCLLSGIAGIEIMCLIL